jgi:hypothetical protein
MRPYKSRQRAKLAMEMYEIASAGVQNGLRR